MVLRRVNPHLVCFLLLLSCIPAILASKPTSFCKCTCFSNSTIIELGPPDLQSQSGDFNGRLLRTRASDESGDRMNRALNCNDCNRKFCIEYNLPKCQHAEEEDIFTTCFQRDSRKDQAVVFIFIIATGGLLVWAALKPWLEKWVEVCLPFKPISMHIASYKTTC
ncbi:hypothetical protein V8E54_003776 [Elaphomyces granulatus]